MQNQPLPNPALLPGDQVRIIADGYDGMKGFLSHVDQHGQHFIESPYGDCLIGPLRRDEVTPVYTCEWFVSCGREALRAVSHPALGEIQVCDSCLTYADPDPMLF